MGWMRQNFVAQLVQLLMCLVCKVWSGVVTEKIGGHPADQCGLQVSQFSVHLINLLSTLLRCSGFTGIQKAVVDQTGSRASVTVTFFGASLALESALKLFLSPVTEQVIVSCTKPTFHHTPQSD